MAPAMPSEQLRLLRAFVGGYRFDLSDQLLQDCLRSQAYDVERAAELLLTGQYPPPPPSSYAAAAVASGPKRAPGGVARGGSTAGRGGIRRPVAPPSSASSSSSSRPRLLISGTRPRKSSLGTDLKRPATTANPAVAAVPRISLDSVHSASAAAVDVGAADDHPVPDNAWLLAERWVSECPCSCRRGAVRYREPLALAHARAGPPVLRFRGRAAEGTLPPSLAALLVPLLRLADEPGQPPLLLLRAESLFEDNALSTGKTIPLRLRLYLPDPRAFFALFRPAPDVAAGGTDESADPSPQHRVTTGMFFEGAAAAAAQAPGPHPRRRRQALPIAAAAFQLLQYAEYGDVPKFEAPATAAAGAGTAGEAISVDDSDDEDGGGDGDADGEADDEDDEKDSGTPDEEANELNHVGDLTDTATAELPEADDPPGFAPGMTLRPYQRQALYWMRKRELEGNSRQEQEEQMALLLELADYESGDRPARAFSPERDRPTDQIKCECGPVMVSENAQRRSRTIDGEVDPIPHPLWKKRFLASPDMKETITFYVNEVFGTASHQAPDPPKTCAGGILADEMGLGKTIVVLSLILKEKAERQVQADSALIDLPTSTLVVVKLSLLQQWEHEIKSKTNLSVYVYHECAGPLTIRRTQARDLRNADIVLTTYAVLRGELNRKEPALLSFPWLRVVLDEAHSIKNHQTLASKVACDLDAVYRWACTGTICHNGLEDVFGLMKFLHHEPWCWPSFWKTAVTKPWNAGRDDKENEASHALHKQNIAMVLTRVKKLLAPLMIRRTKKNVKLDLSQVDTRIIEVDFTESERAFYDAVLERSNEIFDDFLDKGTVEKSYLKILSMISRLRQTCDHMFLTVRSRVDDNALSEIAEESARPSIKAKGQDTDADEILGRSFFEDLLKKIQASSSPRKRAAESSDSPSKRSRDDAYLANVVKELAAAVSDNERHVRDECPICLETPLIEESAISPCGHTFCKACLVQYLQEKASSSDDVGLLRKLVKLQDGECPCCNQKIKASKVVEIAKVDTSDGSFSYSSKFLMDKSVESLSSVKQEVRETQEGNQSAFARQILEEAVVGMDKDSSKLSAIFGELYNVWELDPGSKVLIFSHYLGFLDMLGSKLQSKRIPCYRFDGSMSAKERFDVLDQFTACQAHSLPESEVKTGAVLLMSMTAGAEGLNITAASSCFIVEPWWNSAKEDQCINRIHRIGQTAPVVRVRKFIVKDSVEEQIMKMQRCKRGIADELYSDANDGDVSGTRLSLNDFKLIFRGGK